MTDENSRKRNRWIAWLMFAIGLIAGCEGLYAMLMADSHDKLAQTLLGALLVALSTVFFVVSRRSTPGEG